MRNEQYIHPDNQKKYDELGKLIANLEEAQKGKEGQIPQYLLDTWSYLTNAQLDLIDVRFITDGGV